MNLQVNVAPSSFLFTTLSAQSSPTIHCSFPKPSAVHIGSALGKRITDPLPADHPPLAVPNCSHKRFTATRANLVWIPETRPSRSPTHCLTDPARALSRKIGSFPSKSVGPPVSQPVIRTWARPGPIPKSAAAPVEEAKPNPD